MRLKYFMFEMSPLSSGDISSVRTFVLFCFCFVLFLFCFVLFCFVFFFLPKKRKRNCFSFVFWALHYFNKRVHTFLGALGLKE